VSHARPPDFHRIADVLYDVAMPVQPWLKETLELFLSHFPGAHEGVGGLSELRDNTLETIAMAATSNELAALIETVGVRQSRRYIAMRNERPFSSDRQLMGARYDELPHAHALAIRGIQDSVALCGFEPRGRVAIMSVGLAEAACDWPSSLVEEWNAIAFHLIAAASLRCALECEHCAPEAVLSEEGKILHAEGDAAERSEPLTDAVRRIQRSRGRWRDKPSELEARTPVIDGRWTLVDQFESDGRHFLVAYVPEKDAGSAELSSRERRVAEHLAAGWSMKRIAYRLGLSEGAVASYAHRASTKLGVRGRIGLARALRSSAERK
jgi:DNA-binding CsgD family transcriptional regulator